MAKEKKFGVGEGCPPLAQLTLSLLRVIVACWAAGARGKFGGLGAQFSDFGGSGGGGDENGSGGSCKAGV